MYESVKETLHKNEISERLEMKVTIKQIERSLEIANKLAIAKEFYSTGIWSEESYKKELNSLYKEMLKVEVGYVK